MTKILSAIVFFLVVCTFLTITKQKIKLLDKEIVKLEKKNIDLKNQYNILLAEWNLINSPQYIESLAKKYHDYIPSSLRDERFLTEILVSMRSQDID